MKVLKFGGSSVADPQQVAGVVDMVSGRLKQGESICLVFSAFGGVTDQLLEAGTVAASGTEAYTEHYLELERRPIETLTSWLTHKNRNSHLPAGKFRCMPEETSQRKIC